MNASLSLRALAAPAILTALLLLSVDPVSAQGVEADRIPSMRLTGTGEVSARPDQASISSGVVSEAKTARAALDENNAAMAAVIEAVKKAGVADEDVQTSGFSVSPRYVHPRRPKNGETPKPPTIVGYRVSNQVSVLIKDLEKLGGVLDAMVTVGANQVNGVSFSFQDDTSLMDQARDLAVKDATRKAGLYASAAGVKLGRILSIAEARVYSPRPRAFAAEAVARAADVPVEAGESSLSISVNITWELLQ